MSIISKAKICRFMIYLDFLFICHIMRFVIKTNNHIRKMNRSKDEP